MKKITLLLFSLFFILNTLSAQDPDFTQFYASPSTLNPALTGAFEGKFRISFIYHDQWRTVLESPVTTFAAATDFRFEILKSRSKNKDAVGFGVVFYKDTPGISFSTNQILLSGAFHKGLSPKGDQYLSLGGQIGIAQRNTNYSTLNFNDQFFDDQATGQTGYINATQENFPENNFAFVDYNVGLNYSYAPERKAGVYAGVALSHILQPQVSFYYDENNPEDYPSNLLQRKYTAYVNLVLPVSERIKVSPRILGYKQGPHFTINAGSNIRFLVNDVNGTALHLGTWARVAGNEKSKFFADAIVALVGIEYQNFLIGFSYDANISDLADIRKGQSTFEVSFAYLGEYENETVVCPKF